MKHKLFVLFILWSLVSGRMLPAQMTVAIGDFKNDSEEFYLDAWEKSVPEFLKSELSQAGELTLVERQQLEAVLNEQALSMTGLMDSTTARTVGNMLGAQYIIAGKINQSGEWIRIDARIVQVQTGEVRSTSVRSRNDQHVQEMAGLLANNIRSKLTGMTGYRSKMVLGNDYTLYLLGSTVALGVGSVLANNTYQDHLADYHQNVSLPEFDKYYNRANSWHEARTILLSLTAATAAVTLYSWIRSLSPDVILASANNPPQISADIVPLVLVNQKDYWGAGILISF